jgi:lipoprotein-anchoring transpeptidase ErfK/SrfK
MRTPFTVGTKARSRCAGGIVLRSLVLFAALGVGWIWWKSGDAAKPRPVSAAASGLQQSNGMIVVPVSDRDGRRAEPMILVPVAARPAPSLQPPPARELTPAIAPAPVLPQPTPPETNSALAVVRTNAPGSLTPIRPPYDERILAAQVALGRRAISSGPFDGVMGSQTRAALRVFQKMSDLPVTGSLDDATVAALALATPLYTNYVVTENDLATLQPVGGTWLAKSQQTSLAYETIPELVAERTHSNIKLVRWLNPQVDWRRVSAGTELKVVRAEFPPVERKAAFIQIHLADRKLIAYDAETNLLVYFPCSIAARVDKRPLGEELHIVAIAPNPNYTFDPAVFPESAEAQELGRKLILQPGPNNPVGTVWLSLDKPGYGIHGTPKPEEVGRTESHGCFRLANWNVEHLLKLVTVGTPVKVEP